MRNIIVFKCGLDDYRKLLAKITRMGLPVALGHRYKLSEVTPMESETFYLVLNPPKEYGVLSELGEKGLKYINRHGHDRIIDKYEDAEKYLLALHGLSGYILVDGVPTLENDHIKSNIVSLYNRLPSKDREEIIETLSSLK